MLGSYLKVRVISYFILHIPIYLHARIRHTQEVKMNHLYTVLSNEYTLVTKKILSNYVVIVECKFGLQEQRIR